MRARLVPAVALAALLLGPVPAARPDEPPPSPAPLAPAPLSPPNAPIPASWVEIATVEHSRGDPARLDPFLAPDADPEARRRAIVALGRIGTDRAAVVPRLRDLLRRGDADAETVLFSAGISRQKSLLPDVLPWLDRDPKKETAVVVAAITAVGDLGDARADGYLLPFLGSDAADAACLAMMRLGAERDLEAVVDAGERSPWPAAAAAAWRLAGARRASRSTKDKPWEGDVGLAWRIASRASYLHALGHADQIETWSFVLRALNNLLPKTLVIVDPATRAPRPDGVLLEGLTDGPPVQLLADLAFRLAAVHDGENLVAALSQALSHASPVVRESVVDAIGTLGAPVAARALSDRVPKEEDPRVRRAIAVALSACGQVGEARALLASRADPVDPIADALAKARMLLASKRPEELNDAVALGKDPTTSAYVRAELLDGLAKKDHADLPALARRLLTDPDWVVRANAASLLGKKGGAAAIPDLVAAYKPDAPREDNDLKAAIVEALGNLAGEKDAPAEAAKSAVETVRRALSDPAPTVRLVAREAAKDIPALADSAKAEDPHPNDWKGLPRPKVAVLGLDLTQGGPWLSEEEILRVAAEIERQKAQVVFETDPGTIRFVLDARNAPVHAANLVLCALAHVYDGTTWHRVVPAFVIQGGDPHGDGSGDAGYALPDEITPGAFERGALGMPKSTKDTGGCQVFVMHVWAPHLDRAYTRFGVLVSDPAVVDAIRVGDRIRTARVEIPK